MILRKPKKVAASKTLSAARAYPYIFMEDSRKSKWWIVATAAVLALLTLYYYTGSWVIVVLFLAVIGVLVGFQTIRAPKPSSNVCLRCGERLNQNARQCSACGSASWTTRVN